MVTGWDNSYVRGSFLHLPYAIHMRPFAFTSLYMYLILHALISIISGSADRYRSLDKVILSMLSVRKDIHKRGFLPRYVRRAKIKPWKLFKCQGRRIENLARLSGNHGLENFRSEVN